MPTTKYTVFNPGGETQANSMDALMEQRAARAQQAGLAGQDLAFRQAALGEQGRQFDVGTAQQGRQFETSLAQQGKLAELADTGATERTKLGLAPQMGYLDIANRQLQEGAPLRTAEQQAKLAELKRNGMLDERIYGMLGLGGNAGPTPMEAFQGNVAAEAGAPGAAGAKPDYKMLAALSALRSGRPLDQSIYADPEAEDQRQVKQIIVAKAMEGLNSPIPAVREQSQAVLKRYGVDAPILATGRGDPNVSASFLSRPAVQSEIDRIVSEASTNAASGSPEGAAAKVNSMITALLERAVAEGGDPEEIKSVILQKINEAVPQANLGNNPIRGLLGASWIPGVEFSENTFRKGVGL